MNSILDRFSTIQISIHSLISSTDREYVEQTEAEYQALLTNLNNWKESLIVVGEELGSCPYHTLEKNRRPDGSFWYSVSSYEYSLKCEGKWTDRFDFSNAYALKYIEETFDSALLARNRRIIEYFKETYSLKITTISQINEEKFLKMKEAWDVVRYVIDSCEGIGLESSGKNEVKSRFKRHFTSEWDKAPELLNDKIVFSSVSFPKNDDTINLLIRSLSLFEHNSIEPVSRIDQALRNAWIPSKGLYELNSCRIKSIKTFMNGKCEFHFPSRELAGEFFKTFSL